MILTRRKYYILSNKLQLIVHLRLNLCKVLFLILTYFSISNLFLILCCRPIISGSMLVLLQSHRYPILDYMTSCGCPGGLINGEVISGGGGLYPGELISGGLISWGLLSGGAYNRNKKKTFRNEQQQCRWKSFLIY